MQDWSPLQPRVLLVVKVTCALMYTTTPYLIYSILTSHVGHCPTIPFPANMGKNIIPPLHGYPSIWEGHMGKFLCLEYPTFPYELCIPERWPTVVCLLVCDLTNDEWVST
jgi:hypothetical protein